MLRLPLVGFQMQSAWHLCSALFFYVFGRLPSPKTVSLCLDKVTNANIDSALTQRLGRSLDRC